MADKNKPWLDDPIVDPKDQPWLNDPIVDSNDLQEEPIDELNFEYDTGPREIDPKYKIPEEVFSNVSKETGEPLFNPDKNAIRNDVYTPQVRTPEEEDPNSRSMVDPEAQAQAQAAREAELQGVKATSDQVPLNIQREYDSQDARHGIKPSNFEMYAGKTLEEAQVIYDQYARNPKVSKIDTPLGTMLFYQGKLVPKPDKVLGKDEATVGYPTLVTSAVAEGVGEIARTGAALLDQMVYFAASTSMMPASNMSEEQVAEWTQKQEERPRDYFTNMANKIAMGSPDANRLFDKMVIGVSNAIPALIGTSWMKLGQAASRGAKPATQLLEESQVEVATGFASAMSTIKKSLGYLQKGAESVAKGVGRQVPDAVAVSVSTPESPFGEGMWWEKLPEDTAESTKIVTDKLRLITEAVVLSGAVGAGAKVADTTATAFVYLRDLLKPMKDEEALRKRVTESITNALNIGNDKEALENLKAIFSNPEYRDYIRTAPQELGGASATTQRTTMQTLAKGTEVNDPFDNRALTGPRAASLQKRVLASNSPELNRAVTSFPEASFGQLKTAADSFGGSSSTDLTTQTAQNVATQRFMAPKLAVEALENRKVESQSKLLSDIRNNPVGGTMAKVLEKYDSSININASTEGLQKAAESKIRKALTKVSEDNDKAYEKILDLKNDLDEPVMVDDDSIAELLGSVNETSGKTIIEDLQASAPEIVGILKREDLPYSTLLQEVIPKISKRLKGLTSNPASMKQEAVDALLALRTEIYDTQLDALSKSGMISRKQIRDVETARTGYKNNILPLSDPRSDIGRAFLENRSAVRVNANRAVPLPTPEAVANAAAKDVANNVDLLKPLNRPNSEFLKNQSKEVRDSVVKYQVANKVLSLLKKGANVKDLPDLVDEKFLKENFGDVATTMKEISPETYKSFNKLLKDVKAGKVGIEALEEELKVAKSVVQQKQAEVDASAISKYFFEGGKSSTTPLTDGYKALSKLFDSQNTTSVKEVIDAIKENGDDSAMNGMKSAYYRYIKDKFFVSGKEGKVVNGDEISKFFDKDTGKTNREIRDQIFGGSSESAQFIEETLRYLNEFQKFTGKGTVVSAGDVSSATVQNDIRDQVRTGTNFSFGPLDPKSTAINAVVKLGLKLGKVKQRSEHIIDTFMADPKYAEESINLLLKDFKDPTSFQKAGGYTRVAKNLANIFAMTPSEEETIRKNLEAERPKPKVPKAVENKK